MRPTICIVAHNAYGALRGDSTAHVGGAELQTSYLARWLAAKGYNVSLLTWDEGQEYEEIIDGVRVIKMCAQTAGHPGVRFVYPRLSSLISALNHADADVYYHNSAEYVTGLVALWCRVRGRKFVYSVASDVACDRRLPVMKKGYERLLYRQGLRKSHRIIVQSGKQQQLLRAGFGLDAVVLAMPCSGPSVAEYASQPVPRLNSVAWVGRADSMKRLEWILDIAERLPEVTFQLAVANISRCPDAHELQSRAQALPNVVWRWNVERAAMAQLYRDAGCLCCTSTYEGFPNTFLEAWSHGRPVVTSFDPDGIVARHDLGTVADSVAGFVTAIRSLFGDSNTLLRKSRNARAYYVEHHAPERAMPHFEQEINGVCPGKSATQRSSAVHS